MTTGIWRSSHKAIAARGPMIVEDRSKLRQSALPEPTLGDTTRHVRAQVSISTTASAPLRMNLRTSAVLTFSAKAAWGIVTQ
jgi:hypothetical protein